MTSPDKLTGRTHEQEQLTKAVASLQSAKKKLLLLAGEAGVGKTHLAEVVLSRSGVRVLKTVINEIASTPYAPLIAILRAYLHKNEKAFDFCGSLVQFLALLIPELGKSPAESDAATLHEAIRCAFASIAGEQPTVIILDDLQWADHATLEVLPLLASELENESILLLGIYRNDEIPRGHPLRRMRNDLRRTRQLQEMTVEPLDEQETGLLLAELLGEEPAPRLVRLLWDHTQGIPLFLEELVLTLKAGNLLHKGVEGVDTKADLKIPIPETVRDAILLRLDGLSEAATRQVETAAVIGTHFDLKMVTDLSGSDDGLEELAERNLIVYGESSGAAFRHALTREAIYADMPWARRRTLHQQVAVYLEAQHAPYDTIAEHWLAGKDFAHARQALLKAAQQSCHLHAYRDAAEMTNRALDIWPEGEEETLRLDVLGQLGNCAHLCNMLSDAVRAWQEVAAGRQQAGEHHRFAETQRRLATVYSLQGSWGRALAARKASADAFSLCDLPAEAATERLTAAAHLHGAGNYSLALELLPSILYDAEVSTRFDLKARALGLQGALLSKLGQIDEGLKLTQEGLSLALEHNLTGPASEVYQRLASVFEQAADYSGARQAYWSAINYCEQTGVVPMEQVCLACLAVVLHQTGEWQEGITLCRDVISSPHAPPVAQLIASSMLGLIYACRGQVSQARKILKDSLVGARFNEILGLEIVCAWGLAIIYHMDGNMAAAVDECQVLLDHWQQTEERHYVIPPLRWAVTFFAEQGNSKATAACAEGLSRIATVTGNPEAMAGLAHALGEIALLNNETSQAVEQFLQSLELLQGLDAPFEQAETEWRAGTALIKDSQHDAGIKHLINAHREARKLGARPLASQVAAVLIQIGEPIQERLGKLASDQLKHSGLTRRQREILQLVARGLTNAEIAEQLTLSTRTVDMHVSHILTRLDSRSRIEAVRKAGELELLD